MTAERAWFVLMVESGRERAAAAAVERIGGEVYLPGYHRWERRGRRVKKRVLRRLPAFEGYLFAGFRPALLNWARVLDLDLVLGVIMRTQRVGEGPAAQWISAPYQLPHWWKLRLRADASAAGMDLEDLMLAAIEDAPGQDYAVDDMVTITHEAFDRYPAKCVKLEGEHARVLLTLFGAEREVTIPADAAVKAGG